MKSILNNRTLDFFRCHTPVVLLVVWIAVTCIWEVPWQPVSPSDEVETMHEVLLLSDGLEKTRSVAYEAVLLDSGRWPRPELLLYFPKDSLRYEAGDVVLAIVQLEAGRGFVRSGYSALLEKRIETDAGWRAGRKIGWTEGKLRFYSLRLRSQLEARLENLLCGRKSAPHNESPSVGLTECDSATQNPLYTDHFPDEKEENRWFAWESDAEKRAAVVGLMESLLLGDRRQLQPDQRYAFADAGAMHVLAVSGLHVGIIAAMVLWLLTLGHRIVIPWQYYHMRRLQRLVAVMLIWAYAFLTGMSVSVMRSALMFSFMPLGNLHKESSIKYNRLAMAAWIILLIDPSAISSASFLLSFSAVWAIMYYFPRWREFLNKKTEGKNCWQRVWLKLRQWIVDLLAVSVAAQIGTLPFSLLFFGQSANYFLLTNIIVLPLAQYLLMPLSIAALAVSYLPYEGLSRLLMRLAGESAWWMDRGVSWVQSLPGATTFITFSPLLTILLIALIISITISFRLQGWKRWTALALAALIAAAMITTYALSL